MGMFDTIHLPEPLQLPGCVKGVTVFQTKASGCLFEDLRVPVSADRDPFCLVTVKEHNWMEWRTIIDVGDTGSAGGREG